MTDGKDADDVFGRSPAGVRARSGQFWSLRERNREVLGFPCEARSRPLSMHAPFHTPFHARPRNPDQLSINPQSIDISHSDQVSGLVLPLIPR